MTGSCGTCGETGGGCGCNEKTDTRCPTCKSKITIKHVRICFDCQKPIRAHHKFTLRNILMNGAKVATCYVHRHCDNPYSYLKGDL